MATTIDYDGFLAMLRGAVAEIDANHQMLSKLDSFGGDGDHGATMQRAMGELAKAAGAASGGDFKQLLNDLGWAVMGIDGGATGPLLGTLFMSMAEAAEGRETLDAEALAVLFEAGLAGVRKRTKAQLGDKTMVDALVPGVEALRAAADDGCGVTEALEGAAEAAKEGAEATSRMQARFGRAKNLGEKSVGEQDPGATSMSLIFKGFWKGVSINA